MRKTIGFDFEKQLPILCGSGESVIPVSVFVVLANALFQSILAGADVELVEGCRIKDITTDISQKQKRTLQMQNPSRAHLESSRPAFIRSAHFAGRDATAVWRWQTKMINKSVKR